jgi:hypothetical protein
MGEAKRRSDYLTQNPDINIVTRGEKGTKVNDRGTLIVPTKPGKLRSTIKFTDELSAELRQKIPVPVKTHKNMTPEEKKFERNKRRKARQQRRKREVKIALILSKSLGKKRPVHNTCRKHRLAVKHGR